MQRAKLLQEQSKTRLITIKTEFEEFLEMLDIQGRLGHYTAADVMTGKAINECWIEFCKHQLLNQQIHRTR